MASRLTDNGPRQHTVMQLGQLNLPKDCWKQLARLLENRLSGQQTLFAVKNPGIEAVADNAVESYSFLKAPQKELVQRKGTKTLETINTASLSASKARSLGPVLLACEYWMRLGFDTLARGKPKSIQKIERLLGRI
ncbi:MAG: hypothetical protein HQL31_00305 [Planctomycetes bacterium]|nr:hypothetical protein [Planctomycetota bacterium]